MVGRGGHPRPRRHFQGNYDDDDDDDYDVDDYHDDDYHDDDNDDDVVKWWGEAGIHDVVIISKV